VLQKLAAIIVEFDRLTEIVALEVKSIVYEACAQSIVQPRS